VTTTPARSLPLRFGAGFHSIPAAVYHGDPCRKPSLSSSVAAQIVNLSPAHVKASHPRLAKHPPQESANDGMSFGSVVHELLLREGGGFAVFPGKSWQGKEAAAFKLAAQLEGKTPIKKPDFARAQDLCSKVKRQLKAMRLSHVLTEGQSEVAAIWKDGPSWLRAMFDRWIPERGEIWDIKTTARSAAPSQIAKIIPALDYDLRSEFYLMGAEKLTGIPARKGGLGYCFLFVEVTPPFLITPCYMDLSLRARGRQRARKAIDLWATCMAKNKWPGYTKEPVEIAAPGWVDFEIEETGISASGDKIL
jgi:PDDEXK-like uncharacterized protein DUF3799